MSADNGVRLACGCAACRDCLTQYLEVEVGALKTELLCVMPGCRAPLQQREVRALLGTAAFERLDRRALERAVAVDSTLHACRTPDCPFIAWCEAGEDVLCCPACRTQRCLSCGEHTHAGQTCAAARAARDAAGARADELTRAYLLRSSSVRMCRRCNSGVVRISGCNHMTCTCGFHFCHVCCGALYGEDGAPDFWGYPMEPCRCHEGRAEAEAADAEREQWVRVLAVGPDAERELREARRRRGLQLLRRRARGRAEGELRELLEAWGRASPLVAARLEVEARAEARREAWERRETDYYSGALESRDHLDHLEAAMRAAESRLSEAAALEDAARQAADAARWRAWREARLLPTWAHEEDLFAPELEALAVAEALLAAREAEHRGLYQEWALAAEEAQTLGDLEHRALYIQTLVWEAEDAEELGALRLAAGERRLRATRRDVLRLKRRQRTPQTEEDPGEVAAPRVGLSRAAASDQMRSLRAKRARRERRAGKPVAKPRVRGERPEKAPRPGRLARLWRELAA